MQSQPYRCDQVMKIGGTISMKNLTHYNIWKNARLPGDGGTEIPLMITQPLSEKKEGNIFNAITWVPKDLVESPIYKVLNLILKSVNST